MRTVEITKKGEEALRRIGEAASAEIALAHDAGKLRNQHDLIIDIDGRKLYIDLREPAEPVRSSIDIMGGDACIRNTRIPVWMLVGYKQSQYSDERILANFPGLTPADLAAAWDFYAAHTDRVLSERREHEEAE